MKHANLNNNYYCKLAVLTICIFSVKQTQLNDCTYRIQFTYNIGIDIFIIMPDNYNL